MFVCVSFFMREMTVCLCAGGNGLGERKLDIGERKNYWREALELGMEER